MTEPVERSTTPRRTWLLAGAGSAAAIAGWAFVPERSSAHIDHDAFLRTHEYMRAGEDYFAAMRNAFLDIDVTIGHARGYRLPTPFWFWQLFPAELLYGLFLVMVVATSVILVRQITTSPTALPLVALFLLNGGRSLAYGSAEDWETWMLVELWVVPFVLGSIAAWRRGADGWAASAALGAVLIRETAALMLVGGLLAAVVGRRPWRPWAGATLAATAAYLIHAGVATSYTDPPGTFAQLVGSSDGVASVLRMTLWNLPWPYVAGLAIWALGAARLWKRPERWFLAPLFALPLTGLLVNRPYWGILLAPVMITFAAEELGALVRRARTAGASAEGSSLPPRTHSPERGSLAAEAAPPSG